MDEFLCLSTAHRNVSCDVHEEKQVPHPNHAFHGLCIDIPTLFQQKTHSDHLYLHALSTAQHGLQRQEFKNARLLINSTTHFSPEANHRTHVLRGENKIFMRYLSTNLLSCPQTPSAHADCNQNISL